MLIVVKNERQTKFEIPDYNIMFLAQCIVESRWRNLKRRSENTERLGGGVEMGVFGRVGVAHLEVGQLEVGAE